MFVKSKEFQFDKSLCNLSIDKSNATYTGTTKLTLFRDFRNLHVNIVIFKILTSITTTYQFKG